MYVEIKITQRVVLNTTTECHHSQNKKNNNNNNRSSVAEFQVEVVNQVTCSIIDHIAVYHVNMTLGLKCMYKKMKKKSKNNMANGDA